MTPTIDRLCASERVTWMLRLFGSWAYVGYAPRTDSLRVQPRDGLKVLA